MLGAPYGRERPMTRDLLPELEPSREPEKATGGVKSKAPRRPLSPDTIFLKTIVGSWRIFFFLAWHFTKAAVMLVGGE